MIYRSDLQEWCKWYILNISPIPKGLWDTMVPVNLTMIPQKALDRLLSELAHIGSDSAQS